MRYVRSRWESQEKPLGWFWNVAIQRDATKGFVQAGSLDFTPGPEPYKEWFLRFGPWVLTIGRRGLS